MNLNISSQLIHNALFVHGSYHDHFTRKVVEFNSLDVMVLNVSGTQFLCPAAVQKMGCLYMDAQGHVHLAVIDFSAALAEGVFTVVPMNALAAVA